MTQREQWEEVSFQVFTGMDGVLRSGYYPTGTGLVDGNVRVAREWGNLPMQPDDDRTGETLTPSNEENVGWTVGSKYVSDTLRDTNYSVTLNNLTATVTPDSHIIATTQYNGFPEYTPVPPFDDTLPNATVPNIVNLSTAAAQSAVEAVDLTYGFTRTGVGATTVNDGKVKSQSPAAGTVVNTGTEVTAVLYLAPTVPNVLGMTESEANDELVAVGLVKGTVTTSGDGATAENDGTVKSQSPVSGGKANTGSAVNLVLYAYSI